MKSKSLALGLAIACCGITAESRAALLVFQFNTLITGDPPGGTNIATMTFADAGADTVFVTLTHNATSAPGQFISSVWFNVEPFLVPNQSFLTPPNKFDGTLAASMNSQQNAGYLFDLTQNFQTSASGGGLDRLNPGESVSFRLSGAGLDAMDFNFAAEPIGSGRTDLLAMIHLQGIAGGGSAKLGAVPEPATLSALTLGALAFLRRRRR